MKLGGNIVAFEIKGLEAGRAFLDKIKLCSLSNLGDTRTIVTHPAQQRTVNYLLKNVYGKYYRWLVRL
jgi:O-acetylhomoserine/O-acetylserine sulfhydrylase-like pyridoxal-dependent enzyme